MHSKMDKGEKSRPEVEALPEETEEIESEEGRRASLRKASREVFESMFREGVERVFEAKPVATGCVSAMSAALPAVAAAPAVAKNGDGAREEEGTLDAKTLANRRKKDKKRARKGTTEADGAMPKLDRDEVSKDMPSAKPDPKSDSKKESAAVKAVRERMAMQRKLVEERRAFEEEQRRLIAEEDARIKGEHDRITAERQRRRDAQLARIQKMKDEGTYQTKKQKQMATRAAMLRQQFGFANDGELDSMGNGTAPPKAKHNLSDMKKPRKGQQQVGKEVSGGRPEFDEQELQLVESQLKSEPRVVTKGEEEEEEGGDDWEALEDKLATEETKVNESEEEVEVGEEDDTHDDTDDGSESCSSSSSNCPCYRSPICAILGHVDVGKTKLLDTIRSTNVQEGEAAGITQQISTTFFPDTALVEQTKKVDPGFVLEVPGIVLIDTPGHESFSNLRARGSSLCDMAILVIDIMAGLELQTVESLEMLKKRRCPFIIALNKCDVCFQWKSKSYGTMREALDRQEQFVRDEFRRRLQGVMLQLNERGLNCSLCWENPDPRSCISIVPTSALTGEGMPDLLYQILYLNQTFLSGRLEVKEELQCTVIEVKKVEGLGTTIDVILVSGTLHEGDQIVVAGIGGPILATVRALQTPVPAGQARARGAWARHAQVCAAAGVRVCAPGLEGAVAGTELRVVGPGDDAEELREQVGASLESILAGFERQTEGVLVKASTLGSLEALLSFLKDMKIPVFDIGIGEVHKKDVKKAAMLREKQRPEYSVILGFDVKVNSGAMMQAQHDDVQIMTADTVYRLKDSFTAYMEKVLKSKMSKVVFPVILQIDGGCIRHRKDPLVFGCTVVGGQLRLGTPICVPEKDNLAIGCVAGIQKDGRSLHAARRGESVCVKIEPTAAQAPATYGRHFDCTNRLFSFITRSDINILKEHFRDEMSKSDWEMVRSMKKVFNIA